MSERFRLTLAQLNPTVGDLAGNAQAARLAWQAARAEGSDLLVLPEMFIAGGGAGDLAARPAFSAQAGRVLAALAAECADGPAILVGGPWSGEGAVFNGCFLLSEGGIRHVVGKRHLQGTGGHDEAQSFAPAPVSGPLAVGPLRIGCLIGADATDEEAAETLLETGAGILIVPDCAAYGEDRELRLNRMIARVVETGLPLIWLNMTGGQDNLVFEGGSFGLNPGGALAFRMPLFDDALVQVDLVREDEGDGWRIAQGERHRFPDPLEQDYRAMVAGLRDYMGKNGLACALIGLSGGLDSALVATIAVDALGAANLRCVMLPSEYTAQGSLEDAAAVAAALGCRSDLMPITAAQGAVTQTLAPLFAGRAPDLTEENIQARLRGLLLMAIANKFGEMLLTTGNKSELAVGYCTIYGDMAGGYDPICDLYKTRAFDICRWRNENHRPWMRGPAGIVIPERVISKPPSAELRPDQKDSDSLPDYRLLDPILDILVGQEGSVADCVAAGFDQATAERVARLVAMSEWKRYQAAPGPRLSARPFAGGRAYPLVNRWHDAE
ncbi:NAD+ synthase [Pontibaca methylaminivorans]|uniref:NAD+ synthase n=1 Tax=Pontibaca methylaminivorans TaxID=515897 RepID=UPI002FDB40B8